MRKRTILYKAGVLFIAAVMVLSIIPAVTADTETADAQNGRIEGDGPEGTAVHGLLPL